MDVYSEVLYEVADWVSVSGSVGKADIGALLLWKRLRANMQWARDLSSMRDADMRTITAHAVAAARKSGTPASAATSPQSA